MIATALLGRMWHSRKYSGRARCSWTLKRLDQRLKWEAATCEISDQRGRLNQVVASDVERISLHPYGIQCDGL